MANDSRLSEGAILDLYAQGRGTAAFDALYRRFHAAVRRRAQVRLRDLADVAGLSRSEDDLAQEALLRAHRNLTRHEDPRSILSLSGWVWRDAHFEMTDQIRRGLRQGRERAAGLDPGAGVPGLPEVAADDPHREMAKRERACRLRECLDRLPEGRSRDALVGRLAGATLAELRGSLGYPNLMAVQRDVAAAVRRVRACVQSSLGAAD